jgi:hypothetical protein
LRTASKRPSDWIPIASQTAAESVYQQSGLGPKDIQVIELHDCFSANELITYEGES